jgi:hypothetical protein
MTSNFEHKIVPIILQEIEPPFELIITLSFLSHTCFRYVKAIIEKRAMFSIPQSKMINQPHNTWFCAYSPLSASLYRVPISVRHNTWYETLTCLQLFGNNPRLQVALPHALVELYLSNFALPFSHPFSTNLKCLCLGSFDMDFRFPFSKSLREMALEEYNHPFKFPLPVNLERLFLSKPNHLCIFVFFRLRKIK